MFSRCNFYEQVVVRIKPMDNDKNIKRVVHALNNKVLVTDIFLNKNFFFDISFFIFRLLVTVSSKQLT